MDTLRVLLKDRLGNLLFQLAAGMTLAQRHGCELVAVPAHVRRPGTDAANSAYDAYLESLAPTLLRDVRIERHLPAGYIRYAQRGFGYRPIEYQPGMVLDGYFQSERYFDAKLVRERFAIDARTAEHIDAKYRRLLEGAPASLHVRRGDYLQIPWRNPPCSRDYYERALAELGPDRRVLVFSDDMAWCRKVFRGSRFHFVEGEDQVVDLYLQAQCTDHVISNSSFSWWGAWLDARADKRVWAPRTWFGVELRDADTSDLLPASWTRLDNRLPLECWPRMLRYYKRSAQARLQRALAPVR